MQPPAAPCQEPAEAVEDYPGFVFGAAWRASGLSVASRQY